MVKIAAGLAWLTANTNCIAGQCTPKFYLSFCLQQSRMSEAVNKTKRSRKHLKLVALIAAVYVAWVAATYVLEGRINLLSRFDPVGRVLYVAIANIAIGILFSTWVLRDGLKNRIIQLKQLGLQKSKARTASVIGILL